MGASSAAPRGGTQVVSSAKVGGEDAVQLGPIPLDRRRLGRLPVEAGLAVVETAGQSLQIADGHRPQEPQAPVGKEGLRRGEDGDDRAQRERDVGRRRSWVAPATRRPSNT
jgi:hypothetical protein